MDTHFLAIFPQGSLSSSVVTTVWVGVCVICFFNLRFGWVLSGLVVPGYLAPLILLKPWSAAIIILQSVVTYGLVWLYSEWGSRFGGWDNFFGRDRFFALLLVSVVVRTVSDTIILPVVGEYVNQTFHISFDYRNELHSFGLIVVALIANQLWKPGLLRGLSHLAVTLLLTLIVVRYLLMPYTNFSLGNLAYMYEDLAASMLASPKAYIILLTTALLASRMNLLYGWEYNGILIPSLLALQWYEPFKILLTFAESFVILLLGTILLKLPFFKRQNIEGARKLLIFFNIGYFYKLGLGYFIHAYFPQYRVSDFFAFGYLLSTLLAVKMHDKSITLRMTRTTVQVSLVSLLLATGIGFALTYVPNIAALGEVATAPVLSPTSTSEKRSLPEVIRENKVELYASTKRNSFSSPTPREIEMFMEAVRNLEQYVLSNDAALLRQAQVLLGLLSYKLIVVDDRYLFLQEEPPLRGWGVYVLNLAPESGLNIQVPAPFDEWGALESGMYLFEKLGARTLASAGTPRRVNSNARADVLKSQETLFLGFQRALQSRNILQLRGYTESSRRKLKGTSFLNLTGDDFPSSLWIQSGLPAELNVSRLRTMLGSLEVVWGTPPMTNVLAGQAATGFCELIATRKDMRHLLRDFNPIESVVETVQSRESIVGYLQDWLLEEKDNIAPKGSNLYQPPSLEQLLFFDQEIITPLLEASKKYYTNGLWNDEGEAELQFIAMAAAVLNYEMIFYRHKATGHDYIILREKGDDPRRYWGTFVLRLDGYAEYIIQAPRPLSEMNIFEFSVALFERLNARALLIGNAHPRANIDGTADLVRSRNIKSIFTLMGQVLLREAGDAPMLSVQCRAFGLQPDKPAPTNDILMAFTYVHPGAHVLGALDSRLKAQLEKDGFSVGYVDGSPATAGYEAGGVAQARYLSSTENKEFVILWVAPLVRSAYYQQDENLSQARQFYLLDIPGDEQDLFEFLKEDDRPARSLNNLSQVQEILKSYMLYSDIAALRKLMLLRPDLQLTWVQDVNTKQTFLSIAEKAGSPAMLANLYPLRFDQQMRLRKQDMTRELVDDFIASRQAWLIFEEGS